MATIVEESSLSDTPPKEAVTDERDRHEEDPHPQPQWLQRNRTQSARNNARVKREVAR